MNRVEIIEQQNLKIQNLKKKVMNVRSPQQKIVHKLLVKNPKWIPKENKDKKGIIELINLVDANYSLKIISNKFDSPNIISTVDDNFDIKEIFISSWAITDIGIQRIKTLSDKGIKITMILDKTHSYKWTFESGAYKVLKNVNFIFTENHSKFIIFDINNDIPICFIGSFNLSNNPRYENIEINRSVEEFNFYKDFVLSVKNGTFEAQQRLF